MRPRPRWPWSKSPVTELAPTTPAGVGADDLPGVLAAPGGWPHPPAPPAWSGMAAAIVETIAPHTEADPVAILAQLLVGAGALVGRGAWLQIEATRHHPNEFVVLVGDSAKARKGSSWDHVARTLGRADAAFAGRVRTGLSTGEGLIWAARDPDGADPGVCDPRLLVVEPEFVTVLKATGRDINTLSPVLRAAWDGRPLALLTRTAPARASAAHIAVVGHITAAELAHHASALEAANGFLNRFCFIACRRMRLLPEGGDPDPLAGTGIEHENQPADHPVPPTRHRQGPHRVALDPHRAQPHHHPPTTHLTSPTGLHSPPIWPSRTGDLGPAVNHPRRPGSAERANDTPSKAADHTVERPTIGGY